MLNRVMIDPVSKTVTDLDVGDSFDMDGTVEITTPLGTVHSKNDGAGYFLVDGYPKAVSGLALVIGIFNSEEIEAHIDFGSPIPAGEVTLFIGEKFVRELKEH